MKWSTVDEAAPVLGMSRQGMYDAIRKNQLPPEAVLRIGKRIRINLRALATPVTRDESNLIVDTSDAQQFQIDTTR